MPPPSNAEIQKVLTTLKKVARGTKTLAEAQEMLHGIQTQSISGLSAHTDLLNRLNLQREEEAHTMEVSIQLAQRKRDLAQEGLDQDRATIDLNNALLEQAKQQYAQGQLDLQTYESTRDAIRQQTAAIRQNSEATEDAAAKQKQLGDVLDKLPLGGFIAKLLRMTQTFKQLNKVAPGALPLVFGTYLIGRMVKFNLALFDTEAAFMKATGAISEYARVATDAYLATRQYGVTAAAASESAQALYGTFTDFTFASKTQQQSLTQTGALLNRLGVSYSDYAKNIQISTKALGMSTEEAEANQADLALMARDMGVPVSQLSSQYASMAPKLAKLGSAGHKAFKDLARVSKITGLEMEKILAITDKFDTFEGAADQAGKLNAALGGNFVNAMDLMMETDPAKRFGMIRDSITQTGLSYDEMSYYQKKFFVDSIDGLNDVGDLAMMMSGNLDGLAGATEKTGAEMIELKKAAAATQTLAESWQSLIAAITPALTPLIDGLAIFFGFILDEKNQPLLIGLTALFTGLAVGMTLYGAATMIAAIATNTLLGPFWLVAIAIAAIIAGIVAMIAAMKRLSGGMFKEKQSPFTFAEGIDNLAGTDQKTGFGAVSAQMKGVEAGTGFDAVSAQMKGVETQTKRTQTAMVDNKTAAVGRLANALGAGELAGGGGGGGTRVVEVPVYLDSREIARATAKYVDEEINTNRANEANSRFG